MYLFSGLSVHLWHPTYKNMDCIKSWLLKADLSSPEHQLARYIVSNLNWGHVGEVNKLMANLEYHCKCFVSEHYRDCALVSPHWGCPVEFVKLHLLVSPVL